MPKVPTRLRIFALATAVLCAAGCAETGHTDTKNKKKKTEAPAGVAAQIGDQTITLQEVDDKAVASSMQAYQALYDARRKALDDIIADRLLGKEAEARGVSVDQLVNEAITKNSTAVTDEAVDAFYEKNKAAYRGRTLEQMGPQIRNYLTSQVQQTARLNYLNDLKKKNAVTIHLEPPRVEVTIAKNDPILGPSEAEVTIVEFSDFQ